VTTPARRLPPIGPRMAEALEFIRRSPGCCREDVYQATGVTRKPWGSSPNSIDRLIYRGLVEDLGRVNRAWLVAREPGDAMRWTPDETIGRIDAVLSQQ
jgi:hypothetical protein